MTKKARSSNTTTISSSVKKKTKICSSSSFGVKHGAKAIVLIVVLVTTGLLVQVWNTPSTTTIMKSYLSRGMGIGVVEGRYLREEEEDGAIQFSHRLLSDSSNSTSTTNSWIQRFMNWLQKMIQQRFGKPSNSTSNADSPITCGNTTCHKGEYCCNEDCGICTRIGAMCINAHCNRTRDKECETDVDCPTIYCIRAPCPHNVCTKDKKCELVTNETDSGSKNETSLPCKHNRDCPVPAICDPTNDQDCNIGNCDKATMTCQLSPPITGVPCGNTTCGDGEYCCNKSCGMCAKMGVMCTLMSCSEDDNGNATVGNEDGDFCQSAADCPTINCIRAPCPTYICNADTNRCEFHETNTTTPNDIRCGNTTCGDGEYCCNEDCGLCTKFGAMCIHAECNSTATPPTDIPCGNTTCIDGEYCCNEGCGMCVPRGAMCINVHCDNNETTISGAPCGNTTCGDREYCCSEGCSMCAPIGAMCLAICNSSTNSTNDNSDTCHADSDCPVINCIKAPCPVYVCGANKTCVLTTPILCGDKVCQEGDTCCNPSCGGHCAKPGELCSDLACISPTKSPKLEKCGNITCGPDEFCCNESCGICAPVKDGHCIEIACVPPASDNTTKCGKNICTADEYCCNESCGICLNKMMGRPCIGGICTNEKCNSNFDCPPPPDCFTDVCPRSFCVDGFCRRLPSGGGAIVSNTLPVTVQCGDVQCPYGKTCCNPSCGVCTFPHEPCTLQACVNNGA